MAIWLSQEADNPGFRPLIDVIVDSLRLHFPLRSQEEHADLAEKMLPAVALSLERLASESKEDGVEPPFQLSTDADTAYLRAVESPASKLLDRLLALSPTDFESFCADILQRMGGRSSVTGRTGDGGVDFVACDLSFFPHQGPASPGARVLVLGQAKRYDRENFVTEVELRSFVGGALRKASDQEDSRTFRTAVLAPIVFAFWTTSDFHHLARKYARGMGLWYLNGIGLAQLAIRLGVSLH